MTQRIELLMKQFSISQTLAKLMEKYNCQTPEDYKKIKRQREALKPKKAPVAKAAPAPAPAKGKKK